MDKFVIRGGKRLKGTIRISGSKNAALPLMASTILAPGTHKFYNVPDLRDVHSMKLLMEHLGAKVHFFRNTLEIDTTDIKDLTAPYDIVRKMRASIYVLGALIGRFKKAKVSLPGGCAWGPRPVNLHIEGIKKLNVKVNIERGYINAKTRNLKGNIINFPKSSVGATGNIMMASVLAKDTTIIENAAKEPEIVALAEYLVKLGADIEGIGTDKLVIKGVNVLKPSENEIIPDRIETGTFLVAGAIAGEEVEVTNCIPEHCKAVIDKLEKTGTSLKIKNSSILIIPPEKLNSVDVITDIYPGFPTDMQAQWIALMSTAKGKSYIEDKIFYDRFTHVAELIRLGANIEMDRNTAIVKGVDKLKGAPVMSTDLRASASLVLAGLIASGNTEILRIYHIDRGYEKIEEKLQKVGADIIRVPT